MASAQRFAALSQRGLVQVAAPQELAERQREVLAQNQLADSRPVAVPPPIALPTASDTAGMMNGGVSGGTRFFGGQLAAGGEANGASTINSTTLSVAPPAAPVAAGIRSIRIELPQTGTPFTFTKVLNIHGEPLSIRAKIIPLRTFQTFQMLWQSAAFLLGLVVWWTQWHRAHRNTFILAVALALIVGSVGSLLIEWRALHDALIVGFPVAVVAVIALLVWKYWPRGRKPAVAVEPPPPQSSPAPEMGIPPVVALIALLLALNVASATAANSTVGGASILSANYSGTVNDRVAQLEATLQFSGVNTGDIVPLFGDDVAVQQFSVKNGKAEFIRNGGNIAVQFGSKGGVTLQIQMLVKIAGDVTKRRLAFAVPAALSSRAGFALAETEADVDFPAAISFKRILDKNQTRVEAVLGSSDRIELLWTPRVKRTEEIAATVFCRNTALVTFGGGVMNVRATLDYQITQGELRQARVQLPAGQKLLRVEGQGLRTWEIKDVNGAQTLVVDLMKGVPLGWQLTVETEKILDALPASAAVALPHALDVKRENGLVALRGSDELGLSVESAAGLERVDAEEFARVSTGAKRGQACQRVPVFQSGIFFARARRSLPAGDRSRGEK